MSLIVIILLLTSPLLHYKTDWDDKRVVLSKFYGANGSEFVKYPIKIFEKGIYKIGDFLSQRMFYIGDGKISSRMKNGSPLSWDNFLASLSLTLQLQIINNNNIIISCSDDLVDNNDDLQTFRLNGKHNLIMMTGHLKVYLNIVDSDLQI